MQIPKFKFKLLLEVCTLIVGVGLVIAINRLDSSLDTANEEVINNRIVDCRVLLSLGQQIQPNGPCDIGGIRGELERFEIVPVGTVADHVVTQKLLCSSITAPTDQVHRECEEVLNGRE